VGDVNVGHERSTTVDRSVLSGRRGVKVVGAHVDSSCVTDLLTVGDAAPVAADAPDARVGSMSRRSGTWAWALVVCMVAFAIYYASPVRLETDSYWVVFTARSLVAHGDADLDEYHSIIDHGTGFQVERWRGHFYYEAPLATSLAAVPFVAVASVVDGRALDRRLASGHAQPLDGIIAAVIAALATALMFLVVSQLTPRRWIALATTTVFAFGTQVWSTASRTLWMHGPSLVCLTVALLLALRVKRSGGCCFALGAALGLAYFVRPTNVVPLVVFATWVAMRGRRPVIRFACGAGVVAASFFALDLLVYGRPLQPYFRASRVALSTTTVEALLGNLVSPARGLLVFVPVTLVCGYGFLMKRRTGTLSSLDVAVATSAVGYWLLVSTFPSWWAGWSYGPRFLTDVAPFLVWFLPPVFAAVADRRRIALGVFAALAIVLSISIQARGALSQSTADWNWKPRDVGTDRARLWDWSDPQFLR
jgi:hypothetical protein